MKISQILFLLSFFLFSLQPKTKIVELITSFRSTFIETILKQISIVLM